MIGILNNPGWVYERGRRKIKVDGHDVEVPSLSGRTFSFEQAREIEIDGVLQIRGASPVYVRYVGATRPDRARATDELYLDYLGGDRNWRAGATASEYEATVRCSAR